MAKDNAILIRLDDEEERMLNDGWFRFVTYYGKPVNKTEYIRECLRYMHLVLVQEGERDELNE